MTNSQNDTSQSSKKSSSNSLWDKHRNVIRSSKGGWLVGKGVINHGYDMMEELVGKVSYMQVVVLNATGRLPNRQLADWLDAFHICLSWPDPRIWCNQMGALGGTVRTSAVAATVAGIMASDSRAYGIKPMIEGVSFIQEALREFQTGLSIAEIVKQHGKSIGGKPAIMGYARPIAKGDERVGAMAQYTKQLKYEEGSHLQLAWQLDRYLQTHHDESMNINGYASAFFSDQGYTAQEIYRILTFLVTSGVTACYVDTRDKPAETFLPMRCEDIEYNGKEARAVPVD